MSVRAGIVVTGTEVLTGQVADRNGPWLSERLRELGVQVAHITICGDRPEDLEAQLRFLAEQGCRLIFTSGGLGPTADDLTLEVVARFAGRELALDEALRGRIADILRGLMSRWPDIDRDALEQANRKQAMVPAGATILEPAGTAPGMVVPGEGHVVVVLPGPPRELQAMWPAAVGAGPVAGVLSDARRLDESMLRLFGIPESEIAATLRVAQDRVDGFDALEITTCLRRGEVEVSIAAEPGDRAARGALEALIAQRHERALFSRNGSSIDDQVAGLLAGHTIALAESCTAGLMSARLAERPGSSDYLSGGAVTYSNAMKDVQLGVDPELIDIHGAVSEEVARAMARGALERFGVDVALSITGIAGPAGGTAEKPVGTVWWCAAQAGGEEIVRTVQMPGDRAEIRDRSTTVGMHLLRRLLRD